MKYNVDIMFGSKQDDQDKPMISSAPRSDGKPETIIGPSVRVDGQFRSEGDVVIDGEVKGSVKTKQHLRVGEKAKVKASIEAGSAYIAGTVNGNIKVKDALTIAASAEITGDITTKTMEVVSGAKINGHLRMEVEGMAPLEATAVPVPKIIKEKTQKKAKGPVPKSKS